MAALLEAWYDYLVKREYNISSFLISPELENYNNEMEEPKVDNVEEYQASGFLNKNKNMTHQLPPQEK